MADVSIIKDAQIVDVENYKVFPGSVVIEGDTIREVLPGEGGSISRNPGDCRIYDAGGQLLVPGFIDVHAHADGHIPCGEKELAQGVTTVVDGNCGISPKCASSIKEFYDLQDRNGFNLNQTTFIGHSFTLREKVGAVDVYGNATSAQVQQMKSLASQGLDEGACGISFGIQYAPGTTTEEYTEVAKVAAQRDRLVSVHTRLNFPNDFESLRETLEVAKNTGVELIVSHLSYMYADGQMDRCLEMISDYQAKGVRIHADSGMYTAFSTMAGSTCYDQDQIQANHWDYSQFVAASGKYVGQHLDEEKFLYMRNNEPDNCIICFTGVEEDIYKALLFNNVMVSSDCGRSAPGEGHPQDAAVFAKFLRVMVREKKLLSIPEAFRRTSYIPSRIMRMNDRGVIKAGNKADIVVLDINKIQERADFPGLGNPDLPPVGVSHVFVNGKCAIESGIRNSSVNAGRTIRY